MKISGAVICQNEDALIRNCIKQLDWVDEIVVIDGGSVDKTISILQELKASDNRIKVFRVPFNGHFGDQKNMALTHCTGEWIFNIDADEIIEPDLKNELITYASNKDKIEVVNIPRLNFIDDVHQKNAYPDYQARFFRSFCRYIYPVHEELVGWRKEAKAKHHIIHRKSSARFNQQQNQYRGIITSRKHQLRFIGD